MSEPAEIRVIREVLEGVLAPRLASVVMFETVADPLPESPQELLVVVRGRLNQSLARRVGLEDANAVIRRIESLLDPSSGAVRGAPVAAPPGAAAARARPADARIDPDATMSIPLSTRPVTVLVVAGGPLLERRLAASLGPQRVAPSSVSDEATLRRYTASRGIALVLVDATDFASLDPKVVAACLANLPPSTSRAVWGAELPYGRTVVRECEGAGATVIALERSEGIEPLLDLVRSRRAPF